MQETFRGHKPQGSEDLASPTRVSPRRPHPGPLALGSSSTGSLCPAAQWPSDLAGPFGSQ
jgi:hypothetical protein